VAIGGNIAIFSVANALLFKPVPVHAPEQVARVRAAESQVSWRDYEDLRDRTDVFSQFAAHRRLRVGLTNADGFPVRLEGEQTSTNFFSTLGVAPALGRAYAADDSRRDLVVLADHTWRSRFGGDRAVIGRLLRLNGQPYEVIGVMPPRFRAVAPAGFLTDVWFPVDDPVRTPIYQDRRARRFEMVGRLRADTTHEQAAAALLVAARGIGTEHPDTSDVLREMEVFPVSGLGAFRGMGDLVIPVFIFIAFLIVVASLVLPSPGCCSGGPRRDSGRSPSVWRSAPAADGWCGSC
jgi:putative ABC transport system permease protein